MIDTGPFLNGNFEDWARMLRARAEAVSKNQPLVGKVLEQTAEETGKAIAEAQEIMTKRDLDLNKQL